MSMLGILSVLIIVHECGHFLVARFFGFQTPVFGFGLPFGPSITIGKKWGTEFKIHAALLGGYVAIPELGDESNADAFGPPEKPFKKFPIWQRALVAVAGVTFNVIFAYFVCLVMVMTMGDPVSRVVSGNAIPSNPIALKAGFKPGDILVAIDGVNVTGQTEAITQIKAHKSKPMTVTVRRPTKAQAEEIRDLPSSELTEEKYMAREKAMELVTLSMTPNEKGQIGLELSEVAQYYKKIDGSPFEIAGYAGYKLYDLTHSMLDALGQMAQGLAQGMMGGAKKDAGAAPSVGIGDLHGVLAVVVFGADVAQQDWSKLFMFTIMISMDLAIINLLPWPALDGGHLAFMLFEAIRGRPMHERAQGEIVKWGFISLIVLMVVIMVNDVSALMTGKLSFKAMKEKAKEVRQQQKDADQTQAASDAKGPAPDVNPPSQQTTAPAPDANASKGETPQVDAPKADAPKADAPKADTPKADTPKADAPKADAPASNSSDSGVASPGVKPLATPAPAH